MSKKTKNKKHSRLSTRKHKVCPTQLQPFEKEFGKHISYKKRILNNKETTRRFVEEITMLPAPKEIKPKNDFYNYVNYLWLSKKHLDKKQKYIVQVDDFRLTQDKVYRDLDVIITDFIRDHKNNRKDTLAHNLTAFRQSVVDMNNIEYSKRLSKYAVNEVDELLQSGNPWKMLGYFSKNEMIAGEAPFSFSLAADDKQSNIFRCFVNPHSFLLLDLSVYYDDGTDVAYKLKYKEAFFKTCQDTFDVCLGKGHGLVGSDVYDVEVELFDTLGCNDVIKGEGDSYNKVTASESLSKYGFDWNAYTKEIGFEKAPSFFITSSLNFLKCGSTLLNDNWTSNKWRTYWIYLLLKRICRVTRQWEKIVFQFYGNFQRGQEGINNSDAVSSALYMSIPFNKFLTDEYIRKYEDPEVTKLALTLCEDLKEVFKRTLNRNVWLSPVTRKKALEKLSQFKFVLGYSEVERKDPTLNYNGSLYDNMMTIYNWRNREFIKLEGNQVIDLPMMDWRQYPVKMIGNQAYIVNASYTPTKNAIFVNLGYMQYPFIDFKKGLEYNLAHLGFTIGHEMSHGFDDWGSKYDGKGNLNDWWTTEDKKRFKSIQSNVIKQYQDFAARDGIEYDASIGIGEDMADISGMGIVTEYLKDYNEHTESLPLIAYNSFEAFFIHFAYQQKQLIAKKALAAQLKTNPHPLDKYRCNIPLSRSLIFRKMYDVKKGDDMWWKTSDTIW